jgi:hypothetical protein
MYETTLPFFSAYGRLHTGLKKLELRTPASREERNNPGLLPPPQKRDPTEWKEDDPVWKASRILDQLKRFEESKVDAATTVGTTKAFGHIPTVPWLDAIVKEQCEKVLDDAKEKAEVNFDTVAGVVALARITHMWTAVFLASRCLRLG